MKEPLRADISITHWQPARELSSNGGRPHRLDDRSDRSSEFHQAYEECIIAQRRAEVTRFQVDTWLPVAVIVGFLCLCGAVAVGIIVAAQHGGADWVAPVGPVVGAAVTGMLGRIWWKRRSGE